MMPTMTRSGSLSARAENMSLLLCLCSRSGGRSNGPQSFVLITGRYRAHTISWRLPGGTRRPRPRLSYLSVPPPHRSRTRQSIGSNGCAPRSVPGGKSLVLSRWYLQFWQIRISLPAIRPRRSCRNISVTASQPSRGASSGHPQDLTMPGEGRSVHLVGACRSGVFRGVADCLRPQARKASLGARACRHRWHGEPSRAPGSEAAARRARPARLGWTGSACRRTGLFRKPVPQAAHRRLWFPPARQSADLEVSL